MKKDLNQEKRANEVYKRILKYFIWSQDQPGNLSSRKENFGHIWVGELGVVEDTGLEYLNSILTGYDSEGVYVIYFFHYEGRYYRSREYYWLLREGAMQDLTQEHHLFEMGEGEISILEDRYKLLKYWNYLDSEVEGGQEYEY